MASDELIEKAARAAWDATENTYGEEDSVEWVHAVSIEKTAARNAARAVLAVAEAECGWEYLATNPSYRRVGSTSEWAEMWRSRGYEIHRRHPAIPASKWEKVPDGE